MRNFRVLYFTFLLISSCSLAQSKSNIVVTANNIDIALSQYYKEGFIIKDSLGIKFGKNRKGVLICLVIKNERDLEFRELDDAPVKRLLLLMEMTKTGFKELVCSKDVLPSLSFGERSDVGYSNLNVRKDIFSFNFIKLPYGSNVEYEFKYDFRYSLNDNSWFLNKCVIEKFKEDDTVVSYSLTVDDFGKLSINEFDIYNFNPFVYL
ncbi:hypothetical protein [Saccharicrinis fermentans]|nr:hypothetical protein [Saccharicrinis fermentans]